MSDKCMALNVRNVPVDLLYAVRAKAAMRHQDVREFVIDVLLDATSDVPTFPTAEADPTATQGRRRKKPATSDGGKD